MSKFKPATRQRVYLKLGITGGPGDGKTFSALRLASGLANGGRIALLDTENNSASLYAESFAFDVLNISPPFDDAKFIDGVTSAVSEGYRVVVIDSFSHSWEGTLDYKATLDARGTNSYINWNSAGKKFKAVLSAILHSPIHVVCCMRVKMDYVLELDIRGKQVPRKVGLAPIMRDGIEFEFSTVFDCSSDHHASVSKDRTGLFIDTRFQITEETGTKLLGWLESATEPSLQERLAVELADVEPALLSAYLTARGASPDGTVQSVSDSYAQRALKAIPRLKEGIEKFRQDLDSKESVPANPTE